MPKQTIANFPPYWVNKSGDEFQVWKRENERSFIVVLYDDKSHAIQMARDLSQLHQRYA